MSKLDPHLEEKITKQLKKAGTATVRDFDRVLPDSSKVGQVTVAVRHRLLRAE
jgi:hypothetical protein